MDLRTKKVLGFLVGKGLLWTNFPVDPFFGKLQVKDALWVGQNVEPRVFEVLPAALIHFPKTFIGKDAIPQELKAVLQDLEKGRCPEVKEWEGIPIKKIIKWTNRPLDDRRAKPLRERKRNKTFRFSPDTIDRIRRLSKATKQSETAFLEELILAAV